MERLKGLPERFLVESVGVDHAVHLNFDGVLGSANSYSDSIRCAKLANLCGNRFELRGPAFGNIDNITYSESRILPSFRNGI
jgi:hypothetical protein